MVWDTFGEYLAREGARMLDTLPILSEPTSRAFTGEQPVPSAFFFLNLSPTSAFRWHGRGVLAARQAAGAAARAAARAGDVAASVGALTATAIVWPLAMAPQANPFVLPAQHPGGSLLRLLDAGHARAERRAGAVLATLLGGRRCSSFRG